MNNVICNNLIIDNLFEYCNTNKDIGIFFRDNNLIYIFDSHKKICKYEHIIFFLEESIKRLIVSEYLLFDATFGQRIIKSEICRNLMGFQNFSRNWSNLTDFF